MDTPLFENLCCRMPIHKGCSHAAPPDFKPKPTPTPVAPLNPEPLLFLEIHAGVPRSLDHVAKRLSLALEIQHAASLSEAWVMRDVVMGAAVTAGKVIHNRFHFIHDALGILLESSHYHPNLRRLIDFSWKQGMSEHLNLQGSGRAVHLINLPPAEEDVATILALLAYIRTPMSIAEIAEANVIPLPSVQRYVSQLVDAEKIKVVFGVHSAGYTLA